MDNKKIIVTIIVFILIFWMFGFEISNDPMSPTVLQQLEIQDTAFIPDSFSRSVLGSISQGSLEPVSIAGHPDLEKDYITDPFGNTLYITTKSKCVGDCLTEWPPYVARQPISNEDGKLGTAYHKDLEVLQYTWNGQYLYYYGGDKNPGDIKGNGIGGVWFVVEE